MKKILLAAAASMVMMTGAAHADTWVMTSVGCIMNNAVIVSRSMCAIQVNPVVSSEKATAEVSKGGVRQSSAKTGK